MKKFCKILCSICLLISSSLIFFACKDDITPKILQAPANFGMVNNGELDDETFDFINNQYLLVVEKNANASSYKFYLTDNSNYQSLNNYVGYETTNNYFDVTNIFDSKKVYHYFVQYIGDGKKYLNSEYSTIKSYTPDPEMVDAPYVQLTGEKLCWTQILNANSYEIYETILNKDNSIVQEKTKIATVNYNVFEYDISARFSDVNYPYYKYNYEVLSLASGFYENSNFSNKVEYIKNVNLETPKNLSVSKEDNDYYLSWDNTKYATSYMVKINGNTPIEINSTKLNITAYLTNYASFTFSVKANKSDAISYIESDYSNDLVYDYKTKLQMPNNLTVATEGEFIKVEFDNVNLATNGYTLKVYYLGSLVKTISDFESGNLLRSTELVGELDADKDITIEVYANNVGEYIERSESARVNYTILKPTQV